MAVMRGLLFVLLVFVFGCTTNNIVRDEAAPPIEYGMGRVDTTVCGHHAIGTNLCWVPKGPTPNDVWIHVRTVFSGRVVIRSLGKWSCNIDESIAYQDFATVSIRLSDYIKDFKNSCLVNVLLFPKWPGQEKSDIPIKGFKGTVYFMAQSQNTRLGQFVAKNMSSGVQNDAMVYPGAYLISMRGIGGKMLPLEGEEFGLSTGGSKSGIVRMAGCGGDITKEYKDQSHVSFRLSELMGKLPSTENCTLYARMVPDDMDQDFVFAVGVELYHPNISLLPRPVVSVKKNRIKFSSPAPVSWTFGYSDKEGKSVNGASGELDLKGSFFILHQITSAGRTKIVKIVDGKIVWER